MRSETASKLSAMAAGFFPEELLDDSSTICAEHGKRFSIPKARHDGVVRCELKQWQATPKAQKSCDCVFLCASGTQQTFSLVLVELKGKRVDTALEQLEATFRLLCKKHEPFLPSMGHREANHGMGSQGKSGYTHSLYHLGIIVAPGGGREFDRRQKERARLLNEYGLKVMLFNQQSAQMHLDEILKESTSKTP